MGPWQPEITFDATAFYLAQSLLLLVDNERKRLTESAQPDTAKQTR